MLPKRACAPMRCEVARMLKLTGDAVEPISFIVPRKSEAFQVRTHSYRYTLLLLLLSALHGPHFLYPTGLMMIY